METIFPYQNWTELPNLDPQPGMSSVARTQRGWMILCQKMISQALEILVRDP